MRIPVIEFNYQIKLINKLYYAFSNGNVNGNQLGLYACLLAPPPPPPGQPLNNSDDRKKSVILMSDKADYRIVDFLVQETATSIAICMCPFPKLKDYLNVKVAI